MRKQTTVGALIGITLLVLAFNVPLAMAKPVKYDPLPDLPGFFTDPKNNHSTSEQAFWHYKGNPKNNDAHCNAWSDAVDPLSPTFDPNAPDLEGPAC
ncbi:MAG: hypothetical protein O6846_02445 [Thaumarchaeota archaeon]|nr:hypothetical protein [Nitrososphaerota archaeon]